MNVDDHPNLYYRARMKLDQLKAGGEGVVDNMSSPAAPPERARVKLGQLKAGGEGVVDKAESAAPTKRSRMKLRQLKGVKMQTAQRVQPDAADLGLTASMDSVSSQSSLCEYVASATGVRRLVVSTDSEARSPNASSDLGSFAADVSPQQRALDDWLANAELQSPRAVGAVGEGVVDNMDRPAAQERTRVKLGQPKAGGEGAVDNMSSPAAHL